jgi:formylmethanofuran dehydrogenase subunit E
MMYRTDDPNADFNRWDNDQQKQLDRLPKCAECGEPIQDEECFEIDGGLVCPECLKSNHRKWTSDYTE